MENRITGVMVYYYFVCKRKLWYFSNEIHMEEDNENVQLGKLLDEESYKRDEKHINIDNIINIDFIKDHNELHEIKKSRAIEEAGIWQIKYYLYYLEKRGVSNLKAKIDYPLIKKTLVVELSDSDKTELDSILKENFHLFLKRKKSVLSVHIMISVLFRRILWDKVFMYIMMGILNVKTTH